MSNAQQPSLPLDPKLEKLAQKRAKAKMGWFFHLGIYLVVNAILIGLSLWHGRAWAVFPLLGWGIGLMFHGLAVWRCAYGSNWHNKLLEKERQALRDTLPKQQA